MRTRVLAIAAVLSVVLIANANAVAPKAGAKFVGALYPGHINTVTSLYDSNPAGNEKPFALTVAKSGKTAQLLWWCGHVKNLNFRQKANVTIAADGTFSFHAGTSSYTIWQVKGRFVSPTSARVTLQVPSTCDGKGGTVTLKAASA